MLRPFRGSKIIAIGKNYALHKVEMGGTPERLERPCFFLKPPSSLAYAGQPIVRPALCKDMHFEVELGVVLAQRAKHLKPGASPDWWKPYVSSYVVALDMTARDLQAEAKKTGMPWSMSKGFDTFCAVSDEVPASAVPNPHDLSLQLRVDGALKQDGNTRDMLHDIPQLLAFLSTCMTLEPGDLILTGTPAGVGPVVPGQTMHASLGGGLVEVSFPVVAEAE